MGIIRYELENKEIMSIDANLHYVTYSKYEDDWPSLPHTHYFTELSYIKRGNGNFLIEDQIYPVHEGDFIIINANIAHTEVSIGDVPLEYVILGVEGLNFSFQGTQEHIIFNCKHEHPDFPFFMDYLLSEMEEKKPNFELVCQNMLEVLIVRLMRHITLSYEPAPFVKSSHECIKIKQYIETNYTRDITLDSLAQVSHLNKYYMAHAFTKCFGCSPMSYLCGVRIKASQELLASTNYSITQIAQSSGFSSQSYFAQCFQKHCHISASAYRKACREKKLP